MFTASVARHPVVRHPVVRHPVAVHPVAVHPVGGARRSRTADLLNAILKTSKTLAFRSFPQPAQIRL
jgi:hypothetical protein